MGTRSRISSGFYYMKTKTSVSDLIRIISQGKEGLQNMKKTKDAEVNPMIGKKVILDRANGVYVIEVEDIRDGMFISKVLEILEKKNDYPYSVGEEAKFGVNESKYLVKPYKMRNQYETD